MDSWRIDGLSWYVSNGRQDVQKKRRGRYLWDMVKALVERRSIVMFWVGVTAEAGCAQDGHMRVEDRQRFEDEFI